MPRIEMPRIEGRLAKVLRNKATVITRAVFWKILHNTEQEDICLKLGRYKKPADFDESEEPESMEPKSELTLDQEEFRSLIEFLRQSYEPFRQGVKAFIPLDRPFDAENARQIRALFSIQTSEILSTSFLTMRSFRKSWLPVCGKHVERVRFASSRQCSVKTFLKACGRSGFKPTAGYWGASSFVSSMRGISTRTTSQTSSWKPTTGFLTSSRSSAPREG